jgi:hypothetical protein
MKVYELVRSIGYTRNILNHFSITMYDNETSNIVTVKRPSADEYVQLCGRDIMEWVPWSDYLENADDPTDGIDITVPMERWDMETFKN